jgi:DNA-binding CsgD family transcriptional regulator/PAS domain-containing protein
LVAAGDFLQPDGESLAMQNGPAIAELSDVIGAIYDCAIDPSRWEAALREVCAATRCFAGVLGVHNLTTGTARLHVAWNIDPEWVAQMTRSAPEVEEMFRSIPDLNRRPLDEPITGMRDMDPAVLERNRYYQWVRARGIVDMIQIFAMRRPDRIAGLALSRHESNGLVSDHDLAVARLLAPHIRRAITISDVLDMQAITINTFASSLDLFQTGVVLVDRDARIVHANRAAEAMLRSASPVRSEGGEIATPMARTSVALKAAIAKASDDEAAMGRVGMGIPVPGKDGRSAVIHVLPLAGGDLRRRIAPRASAALFVTSATDGATLPPDAMATLFDLSTAETRTLEHLLAGRTPKAIAQTLGVALPTVRTHLARIFAKTGTSRQADLVRLAAQLAPPIGKIAGD